jgi:hypothetical protein
VLDSTLLLACTERKTHKSQQTGSEILTNHKQTSPDVKIM